MVYSSWFLGLYLKSSCHQKNYLAFNLNKHLLFICSIGFVFLIETASVLADARLWSMNLQCGEEIDLTFQNGKVYNQTLVANSGNHTIELKSENFTRKKGTFKGVLKFKLKNKITGFEFSSRQRLWVNYTLDDSILNGWGKLDGEVDCSLTGIVGAMKNTVPKTGKTSINKNNRSTKVSKTKDNIRLKSLSTKSLCSLATVNGNYWEQLPVFAAHVLEAKRRGLELEDCRPDSLRGGTEQKSDGSYNKSQSVELPSSATGVGRAGPWDIFVDQAEDQKICYMTTTSISSNSEQRLRIEHLPEWKLFGQVLYLNRYSLEAYSSVQFRTGDTFHALDEINGENAWMGFKSRNAFFHALGHQNPYRLEIWLDKQYSGLFDITKFHTALDVIDSYCSAPKTYRQMKKNISTEFSSSSRLLKKQLQKAKRFWELNKENILGR